MTRTNIAPKPALNPVGRMACRPIQPAARWQRPLLAAALLSACALLAPVGAKAQVNPEIASCSELKDEATVTQADLCAAHIGCRFVLNVQKTCAQAKGYLGRLQAAIGEGTRGLFGHRKEVTPDAIFTAVLSDEERRGARNLEKLPEAKRRIEDIATQVRNVGAGDPLTGVGYDKIPWAYYGQTKDGKEDGWGTYFYSNGKVVRGQYTYGLVQARQDILMPNGGRMITEYVHGDPTFHTASATPDGAMNLGTWRNGVFEGKKYRPDGALAEEGRFEKDGKLSVGVSYDAAGARTDVNLPAERAAAARTAAQEEQQRAREQAAQAEQQFRTSLQAMNPGQLFARSDELNAQGDKARAREVQRTLVSRFPDHPLAATAAQQMAGGAGTGSSAGTSTASAAPARPAGGRLSSQACEAMKQTVIATKVPPNASITASQETVMFMTKTVLDMIDGNCPTEPGVTPAQIEAERKLRQQQYAAAESACNAVQAGGRRCTPQVHTAARAASTPPANASTVGGTPRTPTISYDPVTGRCIGDREACACQPGLGNSKEYGECPRSGGSSGGGIRTAR
jgi:hypothetical protein